MITRIELDNFRNYTHLSLDINPQVTHIIGDNAQGKTNLLEAIYFLGRGRSFRTSKNQDLVLHGSGSATIRSTAIHNELVDELGIEIGKRRRLLKNGKFVRKIDETWPHTILFAPEETLLFKSSPGARREYLDFLIEGMEPSYSTLTSNYEKVLRNRNRILKNAWNQPRNLVFSQLSPWTEQMVNLGAEIIHKRGVWLMRLQEVLATVYPQFGAKDGDIKLQYMPYARNTLDFKQALLERADEEIARGMSLVGPQRDDFLVCFGSEENNLKNFGSQGQHRSVVLALKLAEVELARLTRNSSPILLLDDVVSELDPSRARDFISSLEAMTCQILLTTTHLTGIFEGAFAAERKLTCFQVTEGSINPQFL